MKKLYSLLSTLPGLFFWLWNLSFGAVTYLGITPLIAAPLQGLVPWDFSLTLLFLILVPAGCSFIAIQKCCRRPQAFLQLFYGVEAPLFLLLMLRLFFMRQLTAASQQIIWNFLLCIAAFGFYMFFGLIDRDLSLGKLTIPRRYLAFLQLGAHSIMGLLGLYCAAVMLFYAIPLSWLLIVEFFRFQWLSGLWFILSHDFITAIWSMPRPELTKTWQWLKTTIAPQNELHIYLSAAQGIEPRRFAGIQKFDPNKIVFTALSSSSTSSSPMTAATT